MLGDVEFGLVVVLQVWSDESGSIRRYQSAIPGAEHSFCGGCPAGSQCRYWGAGSCCRKPPVLAVG